MLDGKKSQELVDNLCYHIKTNPIQNIKYVHGLKRGGLIPAVLISHTLDLEYIDTPQHYEPMDCLIVDDICDSGETLKKCGVEYTTAVLHYKPHTSCLEPTYTCFYT